MKREYNSRVSSKNSEWLLKNLKNTTGDYFFLPHPVHRSPQTGSTFIIAKKTLANVDIF